MSNWRRFYELFIGGDFTVEFVRLRERDRKVDI